MPSFTKPFLSLVLSLGLLHIGFASFVNAGEPESKERASAKVVVKATDANVPSGFKVQKGEWLELDVQGKWRMWDRWAYLGPLGHGEFKKINQLGRLGALVVQIGDAAPFALADEFPFEAAASGEIHLWPNREMYEHLKADGQLVIVIRTGAALKDKKTQVQRAAQEARDKLLADPEVRQALAQVNQARKQCGLEPVVLSTAMSVGCQKHARFLVVNHGSPLIAGLKAHEEHKDLKEGTEDGARAGKSSVIHFVPPASAVKGWLASFYHRIPLLQPNLHEVGIGYFKEGARCVSCIDCISGTGGENAQKVVYFPDDEQVGVPLRFGSEIPNPLPADHQGPAGFPITVYFTQGQKIANVNLKLFGPDKKVIPCHVSTPEAPATSFTQWNTICAISGQPLAPAATYRVELECTVAGQALTRTWRFSTGKEAKNTNK